MYGTLHFKGGQIGLVFMTMGIASIIMPTILGIVADRWVNAERVLGLSHIVGAVALYWASAVTDPIKMFWAMLLVSCCYMPTIALNNTVSYDVLHKRGYNPQKTFPPIRVWGTVGFICAMWAVDLLHWTLSYKQLLFASVAGVVMGLYSFTVPSCPPAGSDLKRSFASAMGLDAFVLFRRKQMLIFFLFAMFLGAALQITNQWGVPFLDHFKFTEEYKDTFGVKYPNILISISQISETLVHPYYSILPGKIWDKESDADEYHCLGFPVWFVWDRKSWWWIDIAGTFDDRLWNGLRLFQHIRVAVCREKLIKK